jgi:hypothetical protein
VLISVLNASNAVRLFDVGDCRGVLPCPYCRFMFLGTPNKVIRFRIGGNATD